jgi:hypothetical protein
MSQIITKFITDGAVTNAKVATGIDAAKLGDGSVSNTEFQRLNGLTGDIQTQLDAKVAATRNINTAANSGLAGGGDLSADRSLSVDPNNATSVTAAAGDFVLIADVSDANNVKKVTAQSIADLAGAGVTFTKETFTLAGGDITNQFVTLANTPIAVLAFIVKGGAPLLEGASHDYTVTGAQVDFENDIATGGPAALIAGDVVQVVYVY